MARRHASCRRPTLLVRLQGKDGKLRFEATGTRCRRQTGRKGVHSYFIAFDSNELIPSVGAEIEQSYAKKRDPYPEKERVFNRSVGTLLIEEQKDVEFYYDFTRLLTVAPKQGVFIGLSYDYEGCLAKWRQAFEKLLAVARVDTMEEMAVLFILTEPRRDRLNIAVWGWHRAQEIGLRDLGKVPL